MSSSEAVAQPQMHLWDLFTCSSASVAEVVSKTRKRWSLRPLQHPYGTTAAVATYSHVLVSPEGTVKLVSDRTFSAAAVPASVEIFRVDTEVLALTVSFFDKDTVKRLGAVWHPLARAWCVRKDQAHLFSQWLSDPEQVLSLV